MKKIIKIFSISITIVVSILVIILYILSPQKTAPFKDNNGNIIPNSIAEIKHMNINGVNQRLLIRGKDKSNPLLLHIHGGPGSPDHAFTQEGNYDIEDLFTVCYWDQRGSGASYHRDIPLESMNLNQIVEDGIDITRFLLKHLGKDKLYLEGHSWGTRVGTLMAVHSPELFHAYIGIGQMAFSEKSEQLSYDFTLKAAKEANNTEAVETLEEMGRPPYKTKEEARNNVMVERSLMKQYEYPESHVKYSAMDIYRIFIFYREYSIKDKLAALKGDPFCMDHLWVDDALSANLFEEIPEYSIPVYILQGVHDKTTATSIAKAYFDSLKAPVKHYYNFEKSSHTPQYEENEKYREIMKNEVLGNKADFE